MHLNIYNYDARRKIALPGNENETLVFALEHFLTSAKEAIQNHGAFYCSLSGGSTPKKLFQLLANSPKTRTIDWHKVYLFWGDERSVPLTSSESNYHMAMTNGVETLNIPPEHIFPMHTDPSSASSMDKCALDYEEQIRSILKEKSFDLVMLGMGDDGHTASLFPGTRALSIKDRLVVANRVPQLETWRMTATYKLINKAHHIVFYVLGSSKAERIHDLFSNNAADYPAASVGTPENPALWILDDGAASKLPSRS